MKNEARFTKMTPKQILLFAPCAFNLAETTRMVEIAKAVVSHPTVSKAFDIRMDSEIACLKELKPVAVVTGSYLTIPVTCRVLQIPLVWVIQSTWLPDFFRHGAGMTDEHQTRSAESGRRLVRVAIH